MPIIDVHAHCGEWTLPIYSVRPEDIEAIMAKYDIEVAILSSGKAIIYDMVEGNSEVSEVVKSHKGFYGYVYVNANYPELSKREVERYLGEAIFKGVGEVHPDYSGVLASSESFISIVEETISYGKPFLIHAFGESQVKAVADLAEKFPQLLFIIGHMGGTDGSTGSSWKSAVTFAREMSNVYLEVSGTIVERGRIEEAVTRAGAEKVMFGSDLTLINPAGAIGMVLDADIAAGDRDKIFYSNAKKIFKL